MNFELEMMSVPTYHQIQILKTKKTSQSSECSLFSQLEER